MDEEEKRDWKRAFTPYKQEVPEEKLYVERMCLRYYAHF